MPPTDIRIVGVHEVRCSAKEFDRAVDTMWGGGLAGPSLEHARAETRKHFDSLRLIVIEVTPPDAAVEWSAFTQAIQGVDRRNWQAPYDEELIDAAHGRWAFFLHAVDPAAPLLTPLGNRALPSVSPPPRCCAHKMYEPPG